MKCVTIGTRRDVLKEGEIWGFNAFASHPSRPTTRHFQLHPFDILPEDEIETLLGWPGPGPMYVLDETVLGETPVPFAAPYPRAAVEAALGQGPWAGSHDYMLALAIHEGFERIYVAAADFQIGAPRERLCEHASFAYWVGLARGRGIEVEVAGHSLRFPWAYGYDFEAERTWAQRMVFWATLGLLKFEGFDDGAATTAVQGWKGLFTDRKVRIEI